MLVSGVLFVPWLPSFAYQLTHTGTPWAPTVHAQVLLDTVFNWAGPASTGALLALVLLGSAFLGFTATPDPQGGQLHVDLRGRMPGRTLAAFWLVPLALAYLLYVAGGSAYAERYTGISLPAFLLLAGLGIGLLPSRRVQAGFLAVATVSGLLGGLTLARGERTQAGQIASQIDQLARPGDVVAYCPDQLAPAVHRSLERRAGNSRPRDRVRRPGRPGVRRLGRLRQAHEGRDGLRVRRAGQSARRARPRHLLRACGRLPHARGRLRGGLGPAGVFPRPHAGAAAQERAGERGPRAFLHHR